MSGYSGTEDCPRCGNEGSLEVVVDREENSGLCMKCGYEYHTVYSVWTLEQVNEERIAYDLVPLTELEKPVNGWKD